MASLHAVALMNVAVRERVATATGRIVEHLGIEPIQPLERKIKADDRVRVIRESERVAAFLERIADALDDRDAAPTGR